MKSQQRRASDSRCGGGEVWAFFAGRLRCGARAVHRDERGAIGFLVLFIMFALLGLMAMVWNTGDLATKRQQIQNAADADAHAAEIWTARTANLLSATNMLICENGSAEAIYRSVQPTATSIGNELTNERNRANRALTRIANQRASANLFGYPSAAYKGLVLDLKERCLQEVLRSLPLQKSILDEFIARSSPALMTTQADDFAQRRDQMFQYQVEIHRITPEVVNEQRAAMADFYKVQLTHALPKTPGSDSGDPTVNAPVKRIGGTDAVDIEQPLGQDEELNHPGVTVEKVNVAGYDVFGGTWGGILCPPLRRYFYDRNWRDIGQGRSDSLYEILKRIDDERDRLALVMDAICADPGGVPAALAGAYPQARQEIGVMGFDDRNYPGFGPLLPGQSRGGYTTGHMATGTYVNIVYSFRDQILGDLGRRPIFMMATYDRYNVPDWAKSGVYNSAKNYVYNDIYSREWFRLAEIKWQELWRARNPVGNPSMDTRRWTAQDFADWATALAWAQPIAQQGCTMIAEQAAQEWIDRKWPYEMKPPITEVPPTQGFSQEERHTYFTLITGAKTNETYKPRLATLSGIKGAPMVALTQAEVFNWMEFNGGYGASDRYDVWAPPAPWRLSTIGGWNWNSRLTTFVSPAENDAGKLTAEALSEAIQNNPQLQQMLESVGITGNDADALSKVIQH